MHLSASAANATPDVYLRRRDVGGRLAIKVGSK
ncbi:hypothetical protein MGAST_22840 [Mycobacterium gastri 'Wayne']|nr:hypothetical protein MGAST_22840 [Mycobacterium gastri 'Wayne']